MVTAWFSALDDRLTEFYRPHAERVVEAMPVQAQMAYHSTMAKTDRAQTRGTNLAGLFIGVMVAAIIGIAVTIPVINDVINNTNLSTTTALIVGFIPVMIGVMLLVSVASPLMGSIR